MLCRPAWSPTRCRHHIREADGAIEVHDGQRWRRDHALPPRSLAHARRLLADDSERSPPSWVADLEVILDVMSIERAARELGVTRVTVSKWRNGHASPRNAAVVERMRELAGTLATLGC